MTGPRHLWAGDWELESARAAERKARRPNGDDQAQDEAAATAGAAWASRHDPVTEPVTPPAPTEPLAAPVEPPPAPTEPLPRADTRSSARVPAPAIPLRDRLRRGGTRTVAVLAIAVAVGTAFAFVAGAFSGSSTPASAPPRGFQSAQPASGQPWLGVATAQSATGIGAQVTSVAASSPAAQAGVQTGDVIMQIDEQPVSGPSDVADAIGGLPVGTQVELQVLRDGQLIMLPATLGSRPAGTP